MHPFLTRISPLVAILLATPSCSLKTYDYKTDMARQERIIDAYYGFMDARNRRPESIAELVSQGSLPEYSLDYSYLLDWSPFARKTRYDKSDYRIFPKQKNSSRILGTKVNWGDGWNFSADTRSYVDRKEAARSQRPSR